MRKFKYPVSIYNYRLIIDLAESIELLVWKGLGHQLKLLVIRLPNIRVKVVAWINLK